MFYVYVIESQSSGLLYIGQSKSPYKRLIDHNRGASPYTKDKGPWAIIFLKEFESRTDAILFEKKLKSWKNPIRIKALITN
ncbi:MAG: GIY-YIG nuclease family protein [Bacteroidia bacterium]|nr:GIY-YIG nuclease family protein [Bacteroidia bacterium]